MAYNLRTGLMGTGDIDVNVSLNDLNASNITDGVFDVDRIPTLGDAKLSGLNASKLTGLVSVDRIEDGSISDAKLTLGNNSISKSAISESGQWAQTEVPTLSKTKVASGANTGQWDVADIPDLSANKIVSEELHIDRIPTIPTSKLSGIVASTNLDLAAADIPVLPKSKISTTGQWLVTDLPTIPKYQISTAETWALADIPNLPASQITSGTLDASRIPNLSALKITSGVLSSSRIPGLAASKITSGTFDVSRLPFQSGIIAYKAVSASSGGVYVNQIGSSYETIDSNAQISFIVPASCLVEVELTFYADGVNAENVYARLVYGGTNNEFSSYVSLTSPSTTDTYVISKGGTDYLSTSLTTKWVLQFPTTSVGYGSGNIDAQIKMAGSGSPSINVMWGRTSSVAYPPLILKATALPSSATLYVHTAGQ
eukprot:COSAG03_NODE_119_length_12315_cov_126.503847_6_plen_428_part_00